MIAMKYYNLVGRPRSRASQCLTAMTVLLALLAPGTHWAHDISSAKTLSRANSSSVVKAHNWLNSQQNPKTDLLCSYDTLGDNMAWTYDQAVGIIALLVVGDEKAATRCANTMLKIRDSQYRAWADGYDSASLEVKAKPIAVGPNAWMGLALLKLYRTTKNEKYLSAAGAVGEFILKQQVRSTGPGNGSIPGGYDEEGKAFKWTSTEHNADSVAFLAALAEATGQERYCNAAIKAAKWLDQEMWDADVGCYRPGYSDNKTPTLSEFPERLDSQTWTILALHAATQTKCGTKIADLIHSGLGWIDQHLCTVSYKGKDLIGFSKITLEDRATPSFWSEGTAGYTLAARLIGHNKKNTKLTLGSLRSLQRPDGSVPYSVGVSFPDVTKQFGASHLLVAHFEAHPNCLFGQVGVYGDGEPDWRAITKAGFKKPYSWYYEPGKPGYNKDNVRSGLQSFRLVNAGSMCASKNKNWASFGMNLGPAINDSGKTKPLDISDYQYLIFWAKTDNIAGARLKVLFRDADTKSYLPQATVSTVPSELDNNWRKYTVDFSKVRKQVNLRKLVHIGLAFGKDVGNTPGTIIYIDDIAFAGSDKKTTVFDSAEMPAVFPQHWPYGSVVATAWFIFAEWDINPFALAR